MSSLDNALVKRASSLHLRKYREREGAFLVEGADLVAAGIAAGFAPQTVFMREGGPAELEVFGGSSLTGGRFAGLACHRVTDKVAARIATLETPADMAAVFPAPEPPALASLAAEGLLVLYADRIADPGNMGTLVRAAAGFGAAAVATSPGSVDLLSPKVVRAGMGAVFALPLYQAIELDALVAGLVGGDALIEVCGLVAHGGDDLRRAPLPRPAVLCVGAERAGLSPAVTARLTRTLTIPLAGGEAHGVESLNAGIAGAITMYEFSRRPQDGAAHDPQGRLQAPGEE